MITFPQWRPVRAGVAGRAAGGVESPDERGAATGRGHRHADLLPRLRALGLAGKVLLGSDFPNIPYPYAEQIAGLVRLGLGEPWLRAVCWQNAERLFGLKVAGS